MNDDGKTYDAKIVNMNNSVERERRILSDRISKK